MESQAEKDEYRLMREGLSKKEIAKMGNCLLDLQIIEIKNSYYNQIKYVFVTKSFE